MNTIVYYLIKCFLLLQALSFESPKNCLVTMRSRGLSTGSVLVILLFVFSALYLIGGAVALRIFRGAVGLELVPNYDFWCDLPALVRVGIFKIV